MSVLLIAGHTVTILVLIKHFHHIKHKLRALLEIRIYYADIVPLALLKSRIYRRLLAEIAGKSDHPDIFALIIYLS